MTACSAQNRHGAPCKAPPLSGTDLCLVHTPERAAELGFIPEARKGHQLPRVNPLEVLRAMVEADIQVWLAPYYELVTDPTIPLAVKLKVCELVFDRVYGKPRQSLEHSGPGGGAITIAQLAELAKDNPEEQP